jgi:hypothetical protein
MKKVVRNVVVEDVIDINKITNDSYVGILWKGGGKTSVITLGNSEYIGISGNIKASSGSWSNDSKKEYVDSALNQTGSTVYVFDNRTELLDWLNN